MPTPNLLALPSRPMAIMIASCEVDIRGGTLGALMMVVRKLNPSKMH